MPVLWTIETKIKELKLGDNLIVAPENSMIEYVTTPY